MWIAQKIKKPSTHSGIKNRTQILWILRIKTEIKNTSSFDLRANLFVPLQKSWNANDTNKTQIKIGFLPMAIGMKFAVICVIRVQKNIIVH